MRSLGALVGVGVGTSARRAASLVIHDICIGCAILPFWGYIKVQFVKIPTTLYCARSLG
jgi:hypothetical protein